MPVVFIAFRLRVLGQQHLRDPMQGTSAANFLSDALLVCERGHISGDGPGAVFSSVGWSSCGGW
jgi:hypothetical protein